ncbi:Porphobilinogen deaminase [Bienertia sinuspersici]
MLLRRRPRDLLSCLHRLVHSPPLRRSSALQTLRPQL